MRIRRALTGIALGGALALGASAAPAQAQAQAADPYVIYGTYSTYAQCEDVGSTGEFHGRWISWMCPRVSGGYQLWVQYR
ncbi:hypothetical protein AB0L35_10745 [Streptomyces sp. NPDC052309]|uniref:hypothetical protein n=1 Tax=Streptomyces sp. NPDC052309 TaxID=3155421 RepID=UPI003436E23C